MLVDALYVIDDPVHVVMCVLFFLLFFVSDGIIISVHLTLKEKLNTYDYLQIKG